MNIHRQLTQTITSKLFKEKAIVITGPRQVGKTTLIKNILANEENYLMLNGDDAFTKQQLENTNLQELKRIIGKHKILFIDEAQRINQIGLTAKLIIDELKDVQLFLSGSSSLDLNNQINEPLTGRKWEYHLYPISWQEHAEHIGFLAANAQLNDRLIYGMYPDVINHIGEEKEVLRNLTNSYLYKDILLLGNIKKPDILEKIVQALAHQIGQEVSYNELAQLVGVNKETVSSYIQLLEKAFIVFRVNAFSRNLRNEIKFNKKIYFYDNGIRNAILSSFNALDLRNDKGALWENFLIAERIKYLNYNNIYGNYYFWRTKQQQEIDWIEERNLNIEAFEFKWNDKKKTKIPQKFIQAYHANAKIIDKTNFQDFIVYNNA
jgi:predicted AAA+ superfamily ATPase